MKLKMYVVIPKIKITLKNITIEEMILSRLEIM